MTDIDLLRRAAALMRERAQAADPEFWNLCQTSIVKLQDGPHIASWHPAVALAVADWLDAAISAHEKANRLHVPVEALVDLNHAIAVARAYLGEVK